MIQNHLCASYVQGQLYLKLLTLQFHKFKPECKVWLIVLDEGALYACKTLSLTLREEHMLRMFENRVLGRIFGPKRESWRLRNFIMCTLHQILFG
jgi:hypothetical protein